MTITNGNYDNDFYEPRLFCSSYFLIEIRLYLPDVKWSGGAACPHWGVLGRARNMFFSWGGGCGVKIISHFGDIIC